MTIQEMLQQVAGQISTERALNSVGLARASEAMSGSQTFGVFALGLALGAGLGLLLAPTSGRELRKRVSASGRELRERVSTQLHRDELQAGEAALSTQ